MVGNVVPGLLLVPLQFLVNEILSLRCSSEERGWSVSLSRQGDPLLSQQEAPLGRRGGCVLGGHSLNKPFLFKEIFIEFVTVLLLFCFGLLARRHIRSPTLDRTHTPCAVREVLPFPFLFHRRLLPKRLHRKRVWSPVNMENHEVLVPSHKLKT